MIQVIIKSYDRTLQKYEFEDSELQEIRWRLETIQVEPTEIEMPEMFQEHVKELKDELLNLVNIVGKSLHINKLIDWMQKKLNRK